MDISKGRGQFKWNKKINFGLIFLVLVLFTVSCSAKNTEGNKMIKYAVIETDKGTIKAELHTEKAPVTTKNFMDLANSGFYNGLTFHRVEPRFVVQGGDPKGDGTGNSGKTIPLEITPN